ncbi:MAG TPA: TolC family protein [Candidatus Desulfaltia sp.]|nr:TolC family protein [Candidatus Desulfaltia sp.]
MQKKIVLFLLFLGAFLRPLPADEIPISLEEAVSTALWKNPEIIRARLELEAARGRRLQLGALSFPELSFSREGMSLRDDGGETEINLGVEQSLEFPGKRSLRREAARLEEEIFAAELDRVILSVTAEVKKAYFQTAYSQRAIAGRESILEVLKRYQDIALLRTQSGQVSALDVLKGRLEMVQLQGEIIEARRRWRESALVLSLLIGGDGQRVPPVLPSELTFTALGKDLSTLKREAASRPSLRAAGARLAQAEAGLRLAQKNALPDFKVGLSYPSLRASSWGFAVGLTLPLWREKIKGERQEAEALSQALAAAREARGKKVFSLLRSAYESVKATEERLALFEQSLLPEIDGILELGFSDYQYGKIDSLHLFDVLRMFKATQLEYLAALLDHRVALIDLESAGESE